MARSDLVVQTDLFKMSFGMMVAESSISIVTSSYSPKLLKNVLRLPTILPGPRNPLGSFPCICVHNPPLPDLPRAFLDQ